jgi:DNA-directed RNA polymerase subunit RPC12/RpoP
MAANQTGSGDTPIPCLYVILILIVLLAIYIAIQVYQHFKSKSVVVRHKCGYCGKLVVSLSKCHNAQLSEKLASIKCTKCGAKCVPVCSLCKKPMDLTGEKGRTGLTHSDYGIID